MPTEDNIWTAGLIVIGDEILSGRTQDANTAYLAKWLNVEGIALAGVEIVPDDMDRIVGAVNRARDAYDYVFTTGGIGPTHDDITVDAVARALDRRVVIHPEAERTLRSYYGNDITEARLRMARVPEGAELMPNPVSGAPGIRIDGRLFLMAGVPKITQGMLAGLQGQLEGGQPVVDRTVGAWTGETAVADVLVAVEREKPGIQIGSYPFWREGKVGSNFVIRGRDQAAVDDAADRLMTALREGGTEPVDGAI
ncbi:competence/damage-inducible protein A [Pacificimonas flava]|uniref:Competence/damage-inducible protein A n=2 Tax=Pacificimonas TaxID=1960290 RepID=A0A219B3U7_9SPHN|nr:MULTISPECIES: competence/damage-inducible protein A [Pacificimonas]MBZ6377445.1 competence/damage-inducible protein A [Pacificimonas aurantium]OWV32854.1 competence/damage-inducible protein A [Pacificimonas flava]